MTNAVTIYALCSSRDMRARYVGQTSNFENRIWFHRNRTVVQSPKTRLACWIKSVTTAGYEVKAVVLEQSAERNAAEIAWIAMLRDMGADLVNGTPGGDGFGAGRSQAHKDAISVALKGKAKSQLHREKLSAALVGKPLSPERASQLKDARKNRKTWHKGRVASEETKAKMSAAQMGHHVSDEAREKMRLASAKRWTPEARAEAAEKTRAANYRRSKK